MKNNFLLNRDNHTSLGLLNCENTPSKPPTALTPFTRIYNALSLMNSMIIGGEQHSSVSITLYEEAMQNLATLESSLSRAQERLKGIGVIAKKEKHCDGPEGLCDCCVILTDIICLVTEDAKPSPEREER